MAPKYFSCLEDQALVIRLSYLAVVHQMEDRKDARARERERGEKISRTGERERVCRDLGRGKLDNLPKTISMAFFCNKKQRGFPLLFYFILFIDKYVSVHFGF